MNRKMNTSNKITLAQLKKLVRESDDEPEYYGDGILHVFDYGDDCPFAEQYVVMFPSGETLMTSASGSVSYWSEAPYSYSTRQEMEDDVFAIEWSENGEVTECIPHEVDDLSSLPDSLKRLIRNVAGETGYAFDKEEVERFLVSERRGRKARRLSERRMARPTSRRRVNEGTDFVNESAVEEAIFSALNKYGRVLRVIRTDKGYKLETKDGNYDIEMNIKKLDD